MFAPRRTTVVAVALAVWAGTSGTGSASAAATSTVVRPASGSVFRVSPPTRAMDTRPGSPAAAGTYTRGAVTGGTVRSLRLAGVPTGATAVALNVTATAVTATTYVSVCPGGQAVDPRTPGACGTSSSFNAVGPDVANAVTVALGGASGDEVEFFNAAGSTQLVVDVAGFYVDPAAPGASARGAVFRALAPTRAMDTRVGLPAGTGSYVRGPVPGGTARSLRLAGVPVGATAVVLNVTADQTSGNTYVSVCPGGQAVDPRTVGACGSSSSFNAHGPTVANAVTVALGGPAGNEVELFNAAGVTQLLVDVSGFYVDPAAPGAATYGLVFRPVPPTRALDTRVTFDPGLPNNGTAPPIPGGTARTLRLTDLPAGATTVVLNVTAVAGAPQTYLSVCPGGVPVLPGVPGSCGSSSSLNPSGSDIANAVTVPVGGDFSDAVQLFNSAQSVHAVVDIAGYFVDAPWTPVADATAARSHTVGTVLQDGSVLVVGGDTAPSASAQVLDVRTGSWSDVGSLHQPRMLHVAVRLADGRVLVVGGQDYSASSPFPPPEVYDPATRTWTRTRTAPTFGLGPAVTLLPDGSVLVVGGSTEGAAAWRYDPVADLWAQTTSRSDSTPGAGGSLLPSGRVLFCSALRCELYEPSSARWLPTGAMKNARTGYRPVVVHGEVVVVGGSLSAEPHYTTSGAELYDPASGTWNDLPYLGVRQGAGTVTALPDGRVLVTGAGTYVRPDNNYGTFATAETLDLETRTWSPAPAPPANAGSRLAAVLQDGSVLLLSGRDATTGAAPYAVAYDAS